MVHMLTGHRHFLILRCQVWDSNVITGFLQALPAQVKNTAYQGDQLLFAALRELKALLACLADIMVLIYQST